MPISKEDFIAAVEASKKYTTKMLLEDLEKAKSEDYPSLKSLFGIPAEIKYEEFWNQNKTVHIWVVPAHDSPISRPIFFRNPDEEIAKDDLEAIAKIQDPKTRQVVQDLVILRTYFTKTSAGKKETCRAFNENKGWN